jgi:hypothetical protein
LPRKDTVPVGVPVAVVTAAVSVRGWPAVTESEDTWSAVFVAAADTGLTVSVTEGEVEAAKVVVPAYCAVRV